MMRTTLKYIREELPEPKRSNILERLSPETIRSAEAAKPADWYPVAVNVALLEAIAAASEGDEAAARQDLVGVGVFGANEAINTFLKLLMKVLTPALFAKKLPSLYERDNSRGKVTVESDDQKLVCHMSGVAGYPHLALISLGWSTFALERMGKQLQESRLHGWSLATPDPDDVTFELHWKVS